MGALEARTSRREAYRSALARRQKPRSSRLTSEVVPQLVVGGAERAKAQAPRGAHGVPHGERAARVRKEEAEEIFSGGDVSQAVLPFVCHTRCASLTADA